MPTARRSRVVAALAAVAAGAAVVVGAAVLPDRSADPGEQVSVPGPEEFTFPAWEKVLGGDKAATAGTWKALSDPALSDLPAGDVTALSAVATAVLRADVLGTGRDVLPTLWPAPSKTFPPKARCTTADVLATSPVALPVAKDGGVNRDTYAKVLVAWTGTCRAETDPDAAATPQVAYVYAARTDAGWEPVRPWTLPAPPTAAADPQAVAEPASWELTDMPACGATGSQLARHAVAAAFEAMCNKAATEKVNLVVESAYRTRGQQAQLFADAVEHYGSVSAARRWVAFADSSVCTSKHCAGAAVNVAPDRAALAWLNATVGCSAGGKVVAARSCPPAATPVPRMATFGFVAPAASIPGYLEFVLPLDDTPAASDCDPVGETVPRMVASIFRCRLAQAGVAPSLIEDVVAQALVVSRAESSWNAAARPFAGRFAAEPNPADGRRYTQAGVFAIPAETAAAGWVRGGPDALTDPVANINGAASLWLATRGFEQFPGATGAGAFVPGPALPAFGGPALPAWSGKY